MNIRRRVLTPVLAFECLLAVKGFAQDKSDGQAKSFTFHGKVKAVTETGLTVNKQKAKK